MFRLKQYEYDEIKQQIAKLQEDQSSQIVMIENLPKNRVDKYLPYAFTEQGVAMLSGVINSDTAIKMNIEIMRAFVEMRRITLNNSVVLTQLEKIQKQIGNHDLQISHIYEAIENLLDENAVKRKWDERKRIGYKDL